MLLGRVVLAGDEAVDLLVGRSGTEPKTLDYAAIAKAKVEVEFSAPSAQVLALLDADTAQKLDQDVQVQHQKMTRIKKHDER